MTSKNRFAIGSVLFGIAIYDDLRNVILFSAFLLCFYDMKSKKIIHQKKLIQSVVIILNTLFILAYLSSIIFKGSWVILYLIIHLDLKNL